MGKRQKELILFGSAVLLLVVLAAMTLRGGGAQAPTKAKAKTAPASSQQSGEKAQPHLTGPIELAHPDAIGRDPFAPAVSAMHIASYRPPSSPSSAVRPPSIPRILPPSVAVMPPTVIQPRPITPPKPVQPRKPYVLTGVIESNPSIAIFRQEDTSYFVRPGNKLGPFVVRSVSTQRVVLALGKQQHSLALGGKL